MSPKRSSLEQIPRDPSYIFAPADPLLMKYARGWAKSSPYLIESNDQVGSIENESNYLKGPNLPMKAVNDYAVGIIKMTPAELPNFL